MLLALVGMASAASIRLRAEVGADLASVQGVLDRIDCACTFVDPLPLLPLPTDDRVRVRTFPARDEIGSVTWVPSGDNTPFQTELPRRYGDIGRLPGRGLWADGGWYPLPVDPAGHPIPSRWDAEVILPPGVVGVLNGVVGVGVVRWEGYADRLALAVIPKARVTVVKAGGGTLTFVEPGAGSARKRALVAALADGEGWPLRSRPDLTIVQDLDLLHLATAAPGMVYLSARAFRVAPGLYPHHGAPVRRAMVEAAVPRGVEWERSFVGGALTRGLPLPDLRKTLGPLAWNPLVDALLHDGTLPYYDAMFDEPFDPNPGLFAVAHPRVPAPAAARQVELLLGKGAAVTLSRLLLEGLRLEDAASRMGIPPEVVAGWQGPYPAEQDYAVRLHRGRVEVERRAGDDAGAEVVGIAIDGAAPEPWVAGPGPDRWVVEPASPPRKVHLDPALQTRQTDLSDDRWPVPWTFTFAGHFYGFSPTQGSFDLVGDIMLRRANDTRNVLILTGGHHPQNLVEGGVGYARAFGPLLNRQVRSQMISAIVRGSLLDEVFSATEDGDIAIDLTVAHSWDTRLGDSPLRGHRYATELGGGFVPGTDQRWARALGSYVQLVPVDARQVLALRVGGGWATGAVAHRLLPLGGADAVRGVPQGGVLGNERVSFNAEYRLAVFRNLSIPMPLVWVTELQVSPGIEAGAAWRAGEPMGALAATFGMHTVTDAFGIRPVLAGATLTYPLRTWGFEADSLQVYVDFAQSF